MLHWILANKDVTAAAVIAAIAFGPWLLGKLKLPALKLPSFLGGESSPDPNRAFAEIQSLRAYAKSIKCEAMDRHLTEAGKCLFESDHSQHGGGA